MAASRLSWSNITTTPSEIRRRRRVLWEMPSLQPPRTSRPSYSLWLAGSCSRGLVPRSCWYPRLCPASSPGWWWPSGPSPSPPSSALASWLASPSVYFQATGFTSKIVDCLGNNGFPSYLADVASNNNRSSLKMIEVIEENSDIYIYSLITVSSLQSRIWEESLCSS